MGGVAENLMIFRSPQGMCQDLCVRHTGVGELGGKCAVGMPGQIASTHCGAKETLRPNLRLTPEGRLQRHGGTV